MWDNLFQDKLENWTTQVSQKQLKRTNYKVLIDPFTEMPKKKYYSFK